MPENIRDIQDGVSKYVYTGTIVFLILAGLFIFFVFVSLRDRKRLIKDKKRLEAHFQEELLRTQLEIQEQTLKNISQEIHDNITQGLTLAKFNISVMDVNEPLALTAKIEDSKLLVGKAINDLRALAKGLNSDHIVAIGLMRAIESELQMIERAGAYHTGFVVRGEAQRLSPQHELIVFRIVQESLNNVIKHAAGTGITISATFKASLLDLSILDNGIGFDIDSLKDPDNGSGLRNMRARAELIGAGFTVSSGKGKGTCIHLSIPIINTNHPNHANKS